MHRDEHPDMSWETFFIIVGSVLIFIGFLAWVISHGN